MRSALSLLIAGLAAGCGGSPSASFASLELRLAQPLVDQVDALQIALVVPSGTVDCAVLTGDCLAEQNRETAPLLGEHQGQPAARLAFGSDAEPAVTSVLEAPAGNYLVLVEAIDAGGHLVANGCVLRVRLEAGRDATAAVTLAPYEGPACSADLMASSP